MPIPSKAISKIEELFILLIKGIAPVGKDDVFSISNPSLQYVVLFIISLFEYIGANNVSPRTDPIAFSRLSVLLIFFSKVFLFNELSPNKEDKVFISALVWFIKLVSIYCSFLRSVSKASSFSSFSLRVFIKLWLLSVSFFNSLILFLFRFKFFLSFSRSKFEI